MKIIPLLFLCTVAAAESKTEAELRQELAASEAARAKLIESLSKLSTAQAKQSALATSRNRVAEEQRTKQNTTETRAAEAAQQTADRANVNALLSREESTRQLNELLMSQDRTRGAIITTGITEASAVLLLLLGTLGTFLSTRQQHRYAIEQVNEVRSVVQGVKVSADATLVGVSEVAAISRHTEKNTNHLKDELVALTAKSSHAEGLKEGLSEGKREIIK